MTNFEIIAIKRGNNRRRIARVTLRIGETVIALWVLRSRADGVTVYLAPTLSSVELEQAIVAEVLRRLQTGG